MYISALILPKFVDFFTLEFGLAQVVLQWSYSQFLRQLHVVLWQALLKGCVRSFVVVSTLPEVQIERFVAARNQVVNDHLEGVPDQLVPLEASQP